MTVQRSVADDDIRVMVKLERPLDAVKDAANDWILGPMHVGKREASGGLGWRQRFHNTTRLRKQWFDFPDTGRRGWAVVYRWDDDHRGEGPVEYLVGWVPPDRERDVDTWISFLNDEIQKRVAEERGTTDRGPGPVSEDRALDDPAYLRERLQTEPLDSLHLVNEDGEQWCLGAMSLSKESATYDVAGVRTPYGPGAHFRSLEFHYPAENLHGTALIFQETTASSRKVEYLAGWVPLERRATADEWVAFLNAEMDRVRTASRSAGSGPRDTNASTQPRPYSARAMALVAEQRRYQLSNPHVTEGEPLFTETIGDGAYRVDEHLAGVRRWRLYLGHHVARPDERYLISMVRGSKKVAAEQLRAELDYAIDGVLELAFVGAFDPPDDPARRKEFGRWGVLVERIPGGETTRRRITGPLSPAEAAELGASVGATVERAARAGVLLTALRPEYIWVDQDATGRIVPLGLTARNGRFFESRSEGEFPSLSPFPHAYGAPESGHNPSERSLVFTLAVLVSEWATGRYPFPQLWESVAHHAPIGVASARDPDLAGVPQSLERLLMSALDPDPQRRPTLLAFVHALETKA